MTDDLRLRAEAKLENPHATVEVVVAALRALDVLNGPTPTVDGDDPAVVARSILQAALTDWSELDKHLTTIQRLA